MRYFSRKKKKNGKRVSTSNKTSKPTSKTNAKSISKSVAKTSSSSAAKKATPKRPTDTKIPDESIATVKVITASHNDIKGGHPHVLMGERLPDRLAALDGQVFLDETEDTYCVWRTEYRRGLCTYYMDLFTLAEDGSWDRSFELHRQRGYSVEQLTQWLEEAGFTEIRTWGDGKLRRPVPGEDRVYFTCIRK